MRSTIAGLASAAVLAVLVAVPAQATVRERFGDRAEWSFIQDCGFPVEVTGSRDDTFIVREGKNKDAGAFPVLNRFAWRETWTNPATGEWFLIRGHGTFNEVKTEHVEGNIFEFTAIETGQAVIVEDSSGRVVTRNRGAVRFAYLFDTLGDGEPGGNWVEDTYFRESGPHPSLDVDFCEYAVDLIG